LKGKETLSVKRKEKSIFLSKKEGAPGGGSPSTYDIFRRGREAGPYLRPARRKKFFLSHQKGGGKGFA